MRTAEAAVGRIVAGGSHFALEGDATPTNHEYVQLFLLPCSSHYATFFFRQCRSHHAGQQLMHCSHVIIYLTPDPSKQEHQMQSYSGVKHAAGIPPMCIL